MSESEFDPGDESTYSVSSSENESSEETSFKHSSFSDNYKEKETLDQQLLHENPSTFDSEKKQKVKKKPSRPCLFCGTFQTRLTRHLKTVHRNEERIKQIACLPVKEQNHEFDVLRKEGIFAHNLKLLNSGKDQANLEMERKSKKIEKRKIKMCTNCKAFLHVRYFYKHVKSCIKATNNEKQKKPNFSSGLTPSLLRNYEQESDSSFTELLNRFLPDEKGKLCQNNQFILLFGQYLHKKHKRRKGKMVENRRIVMQNMRVLAGLYLKFIEAASTAGIHGLRIESMFDRQYIDILKDAIEMLSIDEANELKSGTRLLLGSVLKRVIKIYKGVLLKRKQDAEAEELDKFSIILSTEWVDIFATAEYQIKAKRHELRRPHELPLENDVRIVKDYTTKRMNELLADFEKTKELNMHEYVELRNLAVIKLTFFNARRGGEPSRIQLSEWFDAQTDEWIDKERLHNLSDEEKKRLLENKLVYQGGKGNGLVPVIVTKDLVKVLSILANDQIRLKCGILPSKDFLFPSTGGSEDHVAGYSCIRIVSQNAGVERNLTATKMRHRAATLFANMEMPEADRAFIYKHLGYSEEINKNVYQCPPAVRELTKVGSYLSNLDQNESLTSKEMSSEPNCVSELSVVVQEESTASTSFSCSITQNKSITKKRKETATSLPPNKSKLFFLKLLNTLKGYTNFERQKPSINSVFFNTFRSPSRNNFKLATTIFAIPA